MLHQYKPITMFGLTHAPRPRPWSISIPPWLCSFGAIFPLFGLNWPAFTLLLTDWLLAWKTFQLELQNYFCRLVSSGVRVLAKKKTYICWLRWRLANVVLKCRHECLPLTKKYKRCCKNWKAFQIETPTADRSTFSGVCTEFLNSNRAARFYLGIQFSLFQMFLMPNVLKLSHHQPGPVSGRGWFFILISDISSSQPFVL